MNRPAVGLSFPSPNSARGLVPFIFSRAQRLGPGEGGQCWGVVRGSWAGLSEGGQAALGHIGAENERGMEWASGQWHQSATRQRPE